MRREDISRAVGEIDTMYLEEAADEPQRRAARKRRWKGVFPIAACFALVLTSVWVLSHDGSMELESSTEQAEHAARDDQAASDGSSYGDAAAGHVDQFLYNDAKLSPAPMQEVDLIGMKFVPMRREALLAYFETELPVSEILPDLTQISSEQMREEGMSYGLYQKEHGEVFYDENCFSFVDAEGSVRVDIRLSKVRHSAGVQPEISGTLRTTTVNGRALTVFRDRDRGILHVEWMQHGVGWRICADGLEDPEFYQLLAGLVEPTAAAAEQSLAGRIEVLDPQAHAVWIVPEHGASMRVELPENFDMESIRLFDEVRVTWQGEPATLQTVWAEQLTEFEVQKD